MGFCIFWLSQVGFYINHFLDFGKPGASYCVCNSGVSDSVLQKNIDYACGAGADCGQISPSGSCYNLNTINSYFQKKWPKLQSTVCSQAQPLW